MQPVHDDHVRLQQQTEEINKYKIPPFSPSNKKFLAGGPNPDGMVFSENTLLLMLPASDQLSP